MNSNWKKIVTSILIFWAMFYATSSTFASLWFEDQIHSKSVRIAVVKEDYSVINKKFQSLISEESFTSAINESTSIPSALHSLEETILKWNKKNAEHKLKKYKEEYIIPCNICKKTQRSSDLRYF